VHLRLGEERHPPAEELKGKRIGVPEYQMTAPVWIRGILSDDYGVKAGDVEHLSGGEEEPGRVDKLKVDLPASIGCARSTRRRRCRRCSPRANSTRSSPRAPLRPSRRGPAR